MKKINEVYEVKRRPERVIQFGEGNFLRCFADWMISTMNKKVDFNGNVVVVQPIEQGLTDLLEAQDNLYTVRLNGINKGEVISTSEVVDVISRCVNPYKDYDSYIELAQNRNFKFILSNTTEAGINFDETDRLEDTPQKSFPGKLTALLYERYKVYGNEKDSGFIIIPCELIEDNGIKLKEIVLKYAELWKLENGFVDWIESSNTFCNTLVDRIVPGYPRDRIDEINKEHGYVDNLVVEGEIFHLWVIEAPDSVAKEFNPHEAGLNVVYTQNQKPYRERKVHILNGAHTSMVPVGLLMGIESVRESIEDENLGRFIERLVFDEVIPTLDLKEDELKEFANDVLDRFRNPFIHHKLISISLNSLSKYKTRILPSVLRYEKEYNRLPDRLVFALAALFWLYKGEYKGTDYDLKDNQQWLKDVMELHARLDSNDISIDDFVSIMLSKVDIWGTDLTSVKDMKSTVVKHMKAIDKDIVEAVRGVIG